jgi:hypothetical protein
VRNAGHSINTRITGKTSVPNGKIVIKDNHGDNPAFLQMNQNGKVNMIPQKGIINNNIIISWVPKEPMNINGILVMYTVCCNYILVERRGVAPALLN